MGLSLTRPSQNNPSLQQARAYCKNLAKSHYENFTVGSWLLPKIKRDHIWAIYAFARFVDDLGDESTGDRLRLLDAWEAELERCYTSQPRHPITVALQNTIASFEIPRTPFLKLIEANRMDQRISRFPTYSDLLLYCAHSANPVGHLVLYVFGYRDARRQALANHTCTALQLTNFWQDIKRDYDMNRIYIPGKDMNRFGVSESDLGRDKSNPAFQHLMAFQVERTRKLFHRGLALLDTLDGKFKLDVALFSLGGMRILDAIKAQDYDTLTKRPVLSKRTMFWLMLATVIKMKLGRKLCR